MFRLVEEKSSIMAMIGRIFEEKGLCGDMTVGLKSMFGITLSLPFICLQVIEYCKNHCTPSNQLCIGKGFLLEVKYVFKGRYVRLNSEMMTNEMELKLLNSIFYCNYFLESGVMVDFQIFKSSTLYS